MHDAIARAEQDARALAAAGFDAMLVENFGDAPFFADEVPEITVASMTACVLAARAAAPGIPVGVNVLRNSSKAALAVAVAAGASFLRVNVLSGARVTDQGVIAGRAAELLRLRSELGARVEVWADVDVKHSAPLAPRPIEDEVRELEERALADAVLVTGAGTGVAVADDDLARVRAAARGPVLVASGATEKTVRALLARSDGVIVGTAIKRGRRAGGPVDAALAKRFAGAAANRR